MYGVTSMISDLDITEQILITILKYYSKFEDFPNRKALSTVIYILDKMIGVDSLDEAVVRVYPDGFEITEVNSAIEYLALRGLIDSGKGYVKLTENGFQIAKNLITEEKNNDFLRFLDTIFKYPRKTVFHVALILYSKENLEYLTDEQDLFNLAKDLIKISKKSEKIWAKVKLPLNEVD